jgi:hypothetical protein
MRIREVVVSLITLLAVARSATAQTCTITDLQPQPDSPVCGSAALRWTFGELAKCPVVLVDRPITWTGPSTVTLQVYRDGQVVNQLGSVASGSITFGQAVGAIAGEGEIKMWPNGGSTPCAAAPVLVIALPPSAISRPPDSSCATPKPGAVIEEITGIYSTDFLNQARTSFSAMESVIMHLPETSSTHLLRILWFAPTGALVDESAVLRPGGAAAVEGLTPGGSSLGPLPGEWSIVICEELGGLTYRVGTSRFTIS